MMTVSVAIIRELSSSDMTSSSEVLVSWTTVTSNSVSAV